MGLIAERGVTVEEVNEILASRASLRGILIAFIAEYKLPKMWFGDPRIGSAERYDNHDQTKSGDLRFTYRGVPITVKVTTTCLAVGGFDLLAVNLFAFGQKWRFAFAKNADLPRSKSAKYTPKQREYLLATSVKITWPLQSPFRDEPFQVLEEIAAAKRRGSH